MSKSLVAFCILFPCVAATMIVGPTSMKSLYNPTDLDETSSEGPYIPLEDAYANSLAELDTESFPLGKNTLCVVDKTGIFHFIREGNEGGFLVFQIQECDGGWISFRQNLSNKPLKPQPLNV